MVISGAGPTGSSGCAHSAVEVAMQEKEELQPSALLSIDLQGQDLRR